MAECFEGKFPNPSVWWTEQETGLADTPGGLNPNSRSCGGKPSTPDWDSQVSGLMAGTEGDLGDTEKGPDGKNGFLHSHPGAAATDID